MDRQKIYELKDEDLISFYHNVIKEFNKHKKIQSEINILNDEIENCELKIYRMQFAGLLIPPILISFISLIFGLGIELILNNLFDIILKSKYLILLEVFIFSISIIFNLNSKKLKQKRKEKKLLLISEQLVPLQHKKQKKTLELNEAVNSEIYNDALLIFDDSLNVKLITKLSNIVREGRATNHKQAIVEYYKDLQFDQAQTVEITKLMAFIDIIENIESLSSEMEKLNN